MVLYKPEVNNAHYSHHSLLLHQFWSSIVQKGAVGRRMLNNDTHVMSVIKKNSISPVIFVHIGSLGVQSAVLIRS